ncbi:HAD family hydrolase [Dongia deserti]|uniref:HAD family hydrolase n=1 Tax=Dongia deserti TaxID=2268030 RepID=UPI000E650702|nr:HAD family hydrolase [Dongia deserti]
MISLVIFDCDGVLIDSEIISATTLVEALTEHGIAIEMGHVLEHFIGHPYAVVAGKIATMAGAPLPASFESAYRIRLAQRFEAELRPTPGVRDVLDQLAVPYCAATSSSPERAHHSLRAAGLAERFRDRVFTVSMVDRPKPAPDLFLHAAAVMDVDPKHCLVVEDSDLGIAAAQAAGMIAWQFTGGSHYAACHRMPAPDIKPDRSLRDMRDFFAGAPHLRR